MYNITVKVEPGELKAQLILRADRCVYMRKLVEEGMNRLIKFKGKNDRQTAELYRRAGVPAPKPELEEDPHIDEGHQLILELAEKERMNRWLADHVENDGAPHYMSAHDALDLGFGVLQNDMPEDEDKKADKNEPKVERRNCRRDKPYLSSCGEPGFAAQREPLDVQPEGTRNAGVPPSGTCNLGPMKPSLRGWPRPGSPQNDEFTHVDE